MTDKAWGSHSTIAAMQVDYARARRHLMRADPVLGGLVKKFGPCGLGASKRVDRFAMTVLSIVSQQLSVKAASTIHGRLETALGAARVTPEAILALDGDRMRACGLSWAKVASVQDLAKKVADGSLSLGSLDALDDADVIEALTQVRGIGQWSAEMFLIFRLGRPDILPVGDVGVQRAMRKLYGLRKHPSPARMTALARPWRPYRSVACWYLWRSLDA
jgi:DNA-3-methyladenine glycosylase II